MKIFLTGGTSFVGAHLVQSLVRRGDSVTVLARDPLKVPEFVGATRVEFVTGSVEDANLLRRAVPGHEVCIHNALVWDYSRDELELRDIHAATNLFRLAAASGVRQLLYTSSVAVDRPDFYGATKAANERFAFAFAKIGAMRCNVVRPGPVTGVPATPGGPFKLDRRLKVMLDAVARNDDIRVKRNDARQYIDAADLASVFTRLVHSKANGETYVALAQGPVEWERTVRFAIKAMGSKSRVVVSGGGAPSNADASKVVRDFGLCFEAWPALRAQIAWAAEHVYGRRGPNRLRMRSP